MDNMTGRLLRHKTKKHMKDKMVEDDVATYVPFKTFNFERFSPDFA